MPRCGVASSGSTISVSAESVARTMRVSAANAWAWCAPVRRTAV